MTDSRNSDIASTRLTAANEPDARPASRLGKTLDEDEAGHLRRVAEELGGANSSAIASLKAQLENGAMAAKMAAAARLGAMGERHATAELRRWLESDDGLMWEVAVHGLRHSRDRSGWLCLESVALDHVASLSNAESSPPRHAFRLLVMGRTKTMDRLFRAMDGHSRSIPATAAINFARVAAMSVPTDMSRVLHARLGLSGSTHSSTIGVSEALGLSVDEVRRLESSAWEAVQSPRSYEEIMRWFGENSD